MTAQFWLWVVLSGLGGGIVGWWIRGQRTSGRELTIKREFDNRLCAVEDDARRSLERARSESEAHWRKLAIERDILYARLSEVDPRGRWRASLASATSPAPGDARSKEGPARSDVGASGKSVKRPASGRTPTRAAERPAGVPASHRSGRRPRKPKRAKLGASAAAALPEVDDLKQIKGIGPTFEQRLNQMGYTTFRDLANWSTEDLDHLGERLGARIRLKEWSAQAARLHHDKHGAKI